jgi:uncharacterized membrane protein YfcA
LRNTGYGRIATVALGAILGALVALTSVGAGAIGVVVLTILYPALLARRLIGTDIVHAIPLTLLAGLGHLGMGSVDFAALAFLLLGSIPGIAIGSRVTGAIPDWLLRIALAVVLIYAVSSCYVDHDDIGKHTVKARASHEPRRPKDHRCLSRLHHLRPISFSYEPQVPRLQLQETHHIRRAATALAISFRTPYWWNGTMKNR